MAAAYQGDPALLSAAAPLISSFAGPNAAASMPEYGFPDWVGAHAPNLKPPLSIWLLHGTVYSIQELPEPFWPWPSRLPNNLRSRQRLSQKPSSSFSPGMLSCLQTPLMAECSGACRLSRPGPGQFTGWIGLPQETPSPAHNNTVGPKPTNMHAPGTDGNKAPSVRRLQIL